MIQKTTAIKTKTRSSVRIIKPEKKINIKTTYEEEEKKMKIIYKKNLTERMQKKSTSGKMQVSFGDLIVHNSSVCACVCVGACVRVCERFSVGVCMVLSKCVNEQIQVVDNYLIFNERIK